VHDVLESRAGTVQTTNLIESMLLASVAIFALFLGKYSRRILAWYTRTKPTLEREILNAMPAILWVENSDQVAWANGAFSTLQDQFGSNLSIKNFALADQLAITGKQSRAELKLPTTGKALYFEISKHKFGKQTFYVALSAKAAVSAEMDRARFVQTLSETFAHLPTGMAVFDKERDLSLFNPALSDLLDVDPLWLANKPSLRDFLDRLHDKGALPEPRNFKSWRDQIVEMEKSAETGTYYDDWHMPNDKVFRVTGRPHPMGAVAFVFEDITNTIATEREYRLEIERLYSALDTVDSGIAIFDGYGTLSFANSTFDDIWKSDLSKNLASSSAIEIAEIWNKECEPTPILGEIRDFIFTADERANWSGIVKTVPGTFYDMNATVMAGGYSMIEFSPSPDQLA
jgi:PAS domain-containing protein